MPEKVAFGFKQVTPEEKRRLVREQFDPIARTYDLADTVLSAGLDGHWRRTAMRRLPIKPGHRVLDVCGGTGGLALLAAKKMTNNGRVVVYDFNRAMIDAGREALGRHPCREAVFFVQGDAENMAFPDACFEAVTVGFGIRNFVHLEEGLREIRRVLRDDGALMALEFSLPRRRLVKSLYHFYSFKVMPWAARIICGTGEPFRYLAESIRVFPPPEGVAQILCDVGFSDVAFQRLSAGLAVLYYGRKTRD